MTNDIDIEIIAADYLTTDRFNDSERIFRLKEIIQHLPTADRNILLLYLEMGSCKAIAKMMNCSITAVNVKINRIRRKITGMMDGIC